MPYGLRRLVLLYSILLNMQIKITKEQFLELKEKGIQKESYYDDYEYITTYVLPNNMEIREEFVSFEHDEDGNMIIDQENYYLYVYMED